MSDPALLQQIIAWRDAPARSDLRGLPAVSVPALTRLREHLPADGARRALGAAYTAALKLSRPASVLKGASAASIEELQNRPLADCDAQAREVARSAGWMAGGSGAALGLTGIAGLVADAPALLVMGMRTLIRMGYCYGEAPTPALVASLFALASADTDAEKRTAWNRVLTLPPADEAADSEMEAALRDGLERAAERELAKQALNASFQKLAGVFAQRLGTRKVAGALPVLGAVVGGAVNIRFMVLLAEAARMAFAARRLVDEGAAVESLCLKEPLATGEPAPVVTRKKQRVGAKPSRGRIRAG